MTGRDGHALPTPSIPPFRPNRAYRGPFFAFFLSLSCASDQTI